MKRNNSELTDYLILTSLDIVKCKDCIHKPIGSDEDVCDHTIKFPDWKCPCRCEDNWYSWIPKDNWFCANGETK